MRLHLETTQQIINKMELEKNIDIKIDEFENAIMQNLELVEAPLSHNFFPGIYTREVFIPKGHVATSMTHRTEHPFFVLKGKVSVYSGNDGELILSAPYFGRTTANTRRAVYVHEDCRWLTIHPFDFITGDENNWNEEAKAKLIERIEKILLEPHINSVSGTDIHEDYMKIINDRKLLQNKNCQL